MGIPLAMHAPEQARAIVGVYSCYVSGWLAWPYLSLLLWQCNEQQSHNMHAMVQELSEEDLHHGRPAQDLHTHTFYGNPAWN